VATYHVYDATRQAKKHIAGDAMDIPQRHRPRFRPTAIRKSLFSAPVLLQGFSFLKKYVMRESYVVSIKRSVTNRFFFTDYCTLKYDTVYSSLRKQYDSVIPASLPLQVGLGFHRAFIRGCQCRAAPHRRKQFRKENTPNPKP
jgi:hypothetical protein